MLVATADAAMAIVRRGDPVDPRSQAGDAADFYAERFRGFFKDASITVDKAGDKVGDAADFWVPLTMHADLVRESPLLGARTEWWLHAVGRLAPGVAPEAAGRLFQVNPASDQPLPASRTVFAVADPAAVALLVRTFSVAERRVLPAGAAGSVNLR